MDVKFKKLNDKAQIPFHAHRGDAGMDLTATSLNKTPNYWEYGTGLSMQIPRGSVGLVFPRSSISKKDQFLKNSVGVIDSGYRGEILIRMSIPHLGAPSYDVGDRVAQIIIMNIPWLDISEITDLDESERGSEGFGSSGE